MGTWNSRGLRGSSLEEFINRTNVKYQEHHLGLVQKIPTPITPVKIDKESRHITLAYFDQKSTIDYIGVIQGIPICFDAKECATSTFTLNNIHTHQIEFMLEFEKQKGIAFLLISSTNIDKFYYLPFRKLLESIKHFEEGGKKSFRFDELDPKYILTPKPGILIPYLDALQLDLEERNF